MATSSDILLRWVLGIVSGLFLIMGGVIIHSLSENTLATVALSGDVKSLQENTYSKADAARDQGILTTSVAILEGKVEHIGDRQTRYETRLSRLEREKGSGQ